MKTSNSIIKIAPALLAAQKEIGSASKDATNPFFKSKYADLGAVMEACKDALNKNGITVLQPVGNAASETGNVLTLVETVLLHESGEWISDTMTISQAKQNDPQYQGSAITYARRYSLQSMMFIPAEDDDAEKATTHSPVVKSAVTPTTSTAPVSASGNVHSPSVDRACPVCGGEMWNNIGKKLNPKSPDYKCKDKNCTGVIWPPKNAFPHYDAESNGLTEEQYKAYREGSDEIDIEDIKF